MCLGDPFGVGHFGGPWVRVANTIYGLRRPYINIGFHDFVSGGAALGEAHTFLRFLLSLRANRYVCMLSLLTGLGRN